MKKQQLTVVLTAAITTIIVIVGFVYLMPIIGAFMSIGNPSAGSGQALPHAPLLTVHKIALTVLPFASAGMVYFLSGSVR